MHIIKDEELGPLIQPDLRDFISLSAAMARLVPEDIPRPLIGRLLLEASKCEEMLDAYGAPRNEYWLPVRTAVAFAKSFSRVIYNLFHISLSSPGYQLLDVEGDFIEATQNTLSVLLRSAASGAAAFMKVARKMSIDDNLKTFESFGFRDLPLQGRLEANRRRKTVEDPHGTAVYLASSVLNLGGESAWLDVYTRLKPSRYSECVPDVVSEEQLRHLSNNFHSIQSLYDTYLSGSDLAEKDPMLPVMRGNITVVFHLLDTAVTLVHFYERHTMRKWNRKLKYSISNDELLSVIIDYFVTYADRYIRAAQDLCRDILKAYAVRGEIEVPIPNYRGFHVRPSTLIAKIVTHYGSEVKMMLGPAVYNAALPLELFRANEELNQRKRDAIARYVMEHKLIANDAESSYDKALVKKILRVVFIDLLERQKIIIYDNDFSFDDMVPYDNETPAEFIKRAIALYLVMGKIDIMSGEVVVFEGDKRVLEDIKILAEHGYGEDKFGKNVVLPAALSYLKRKNA